MFFFKWAGGGDSRWGLVLVIRLEVTENLYYAHAFNIHAFTMKFVVKACVVKVMHGNGIHGVMHVL